MLGLKGKRAIVTGAGGGIGNEICARLASKGCDIALFDINRIAAQQVAAQLSSVKTTIHEVDISDYEAVGFAVNEAVEQLGGLDILVNNAGINGFENRQDIIDERIKINNLQNKEFSEFER